MSTKVGMSMRAQSWSNATSCDRRRRSAMSVGAIGAAATRAVCSTTNRSRALHPGIAAATSGQSRNGAPATKTGAIIRGAAR